jgi:wobble nucleotide-excising tRNase
LFDNVSTPPTLALAPLTLIYAENGRGKTTLSAILRSLSTDTALPIMERHRLGSANSPCIVIDCDGSPSKFQNGAWNHSVPNMAIFDDTFVDENICSGLVIESEHRQRLHEFILGAQGVALNAALQQAVDDVETHNRALRAKADAIPAAERGGLAVDDFCALPARADIDDVIQEAERNLAASREQQSIRTAGIFEPFLLPEISTDAISTVLAEELADLEATAAKKVQVHLVGIGKGGEAWVAAGSSTIINHYRAYFSEAYAGLKERVARKIQDIYFVADSGYGDWTSIRPRKAAPLAAGRQRDRYTVAHRSEPKAAATPYFGLDYGYGPDYYGYGYGPDYYGYAGSPNIYYDSSRGGGCL